MATETDDVFIIQSDINTHIESQQNLYNKLKESEFVLDIDKTHLHNINNPDPNSSTITPENVETKIREISEMGNDSMKEEALQNLINNYFNFNYNNNTKLRQQYFEKINNLNHNLIEQNDELKKLKPKLNTFETKTSTQFRNLKDIKRKFNLQNYYNNLYTKIAFIQLFVIITLILGYSNTIPKNSTVIITTILYLLLASYIGYIVLFTNIDRDVKVFDKFKFPIDKDAISKCDTSHLLKKNKEKSKQIDYKLTTLLDERQSKTQCLIKPVNNT